MKYIICALLIAASLPALVTSQTINVTSYGATGDGTTDDTAAINRAIAALTSGSTLSFPCGTYRITSGLTIQTNGVTVTGPSSNCATIKATGSQSYVALKVGNQSGFSSQVNLVQDSPAGSSTFRVTPGGLRNLGIRVGSYVVVQNTGWASNGPSSPIVASQQVAQINAVSGDIATIAGTFAQLFTATACANPPAGECGGFIQTFTPLTHGTIQYLKIDGSGNTGSDSIGAELNLAVDSTINNLTISNFLGTGSSSGLDVDTGYNNIIQNVTCSLCANGGSGGGDAITIRRESYATIQNVTVNQSSSQHAFSMSLRETHFSALDTINIDAKGASGRPFKTLRASYNTISNATVQNGTGGYNGISITDISTHNTFNNCVVLNNSAKGIALFGNNNSYNTLNNCTVKYSTQGQVAGGTDYNGNYGDKNLVINGGTFCCSRSNGSSALVSMNADNFSINNAILTDDLGQAQSGIYLGGQNAVVQNNKFSSFASARDIYVGNYLSTDTFCGNQTPDSNTPWLSQPICGSNSTTSNVQSFGATGSGQTDDTAAINLAILALPYSGGTLYLPCGTYNLNGPLFPIIQNNTTITGPSPACVTLKPTGSSSFAVLDLGGPGLSSSVPLAKDTTSNTFTLGSGQINTQGIQANSYVLIQNLGTGLNNVPDQQTVKVVSISGDTAMIEGTFANKFTVAGGSYVQALISPVAVTVSNLIIDGSANTGANTQGIAMSDTVSSVIKSVQFTNFKGTGSAATCLLADTGYNNHIYSNTFTGCGNGGQQGTESVAVRRQTNAILNNLTITNSSSQSVTAMGLRQTHYSTMTGNVINSGGAVGGGFTLLRSSFNTSDSMTSQNAGNRSNGIGVSDASVGNTFSNCSANNNGGSGIALFGNGNQNNTFTNCTAQANQSSQFGQFADGSGHYTDYHTTVSGGNFCCGRKSGSAIVTAASNYFTMTGAKVTDDNGLAQNGLILSSALQNAIIQNNTFSKLPGGHDIYASGSTSSDTFCGNLTPDGTTPRIASPLCGATTSTANVQDYGAAGNGTTDDTDAINRAMLGVPNSGGSLYFPCGTYLMSGPIAPVSMSSVTIAGPTANCVTLKLTGTADIPLIQVVGGGLGAALSLTQDATANSFTVASGGLNAAQIGPGSYVLVQDLAGTTGVSDQQTVKVTSVDGDTATIEGNFGHAFTTSAGSYIQPLTGAVEGTTVSNLIIDGAGNSGPGTQGINLDYAASSLVSNVQVLNFSNSATSGCLSADTGYNNQINSSTFTNCGNGGSAGNDGLEIRRQTLANIQNVTTTNGSTQSVTSLELRNSYFSNLQNVSIDAGGANGLALSLVRSAYNTVNSTTAQNAGSRSNGLSISDNSTNNLFSSCTIVNNGGAGIALFGNKNQYNAFNNCTVEYNGQSQLAQFADSNGTFGDDYTSVNGGTFCCSRSSGTAILSVSANNFSFSGATVSDDRGLAQNGLVLGSASSNATVQNIAFSKLPAGHDMYANGDIGSDTFCGNLTPDGTYPRIPSPNCGAGSSTVSVQDYGAAGNGTTDDTAAINRAMLGIPNTGGTLYFPCGNYLLSGPITTISMSGVAITGPANGCVTLNVTGSSSYSVIQMIGGGVGSPVALAQDATSNSFTVANGALQTAQITAGSYVLVQDRPGSTGVADQQTVKISSVSGNTATIEGKLATTFTVANGSSVQVLKGPLTGSTISNIAIDASQNTGSATQAINLNYAVNSSISNVQISNFDGSSGGCFAADTGYNNQMNNSSFTNCGGTSGNDSVEFQRQTLANVQQTTLKNTSLQTVVSFGFRNSHFGNVQNLTLDAGGAKASALLFLRSAYNTVNGANVKNAGVSSHGISVSDASTNNTFTSCTSSNNGGSGIALFGNGNQYNVFNNCTVGSNVLTQFGQYADSHGNYTDYYTSINGGSFCCARKAGATLINAASNYFTLSGAAISDDNGQAQNGLMLSSLNSSIKNNTFTGLPGTHNIYVKTGFSSDTFCGNQTPGGNTPTIPAQTCQ